MYLSGSQDSPFDEGFTSNLLYVICNKRYREKNEKYINWKKRILVRYKLKAEMNIEIKNL